MKSTSQLKRAYAVTIFLVLLVTYGYFMPRWGDWNANSRADLVYAVGDQGVLNIDDYHENTGDKACYPGPYDLESDTCQGHYFTDKSIGPSLVALPAYLGFKVIAQTPPVQRFINSGNMPGNFTQTLNPEGRGTLAESVYQGMALTLITFVATSIPAALLGTVIFLFASRFTSKPLYAAVLALAWGLGTIALPYSNTFMQHQLAAFAAFTGFWLLWCVIYEGANRRWLWATGVLFGLVAITEYPVVLIIGVIFLWALTVWPYRLALWRVVLGALPLGILFALYNMAVFATPLPVGYQYSTLWQDVHSTGFLSLTAPSLARYYGLLFSPVKGLFLLSPFLLLALPGFVLMWRQRKNQRGLVIALVLALLGYLTFYASSVMWWGGYTIGPRYLVPMLPFLTLPIIFAFNKFLAHRRRLALTSVLLALSGAHVWGQTIAGQGWPPTDLLPLTFETMNATFPLLDYALPRLIAGDIGRNYGGLILNLDGFAGLVPLVLTLVIIGGGVPWLMLRTRTNQKSVIKSQPDQRLLSAD